MISALAWVDGRLVPTETPSLSVGDRGFLLGDGVFETLRASHGRVVEWDAHLARLEESAVAMSITLPVDGEALRSGVEDLLGALQLDDAALRITISRGSSPGRGLLPSGWSDLAAMVVIMAWAYEPPPAAVLERGVRLIVSSVRRDPDSPLAGVKSTSRADHVYARIEADRVAVDDALFLTIDGRLSETTSANVWLVDGRRIRTPGRDAAILAGTTRAWLLDLAPGLVAGIDLAEEADLRLSDLIAADEAFLSSSVAGVVPATRIGGERIGSGVPGPLTLAVRGARERWIDERTRSS